VNAPNMLPKSVSPTAGIFHCAAFVTKSLTPAVDLSTEYLE
jgi:hypothetical protein